MIILVNFNVYLGGGETLAVRFSDFLKKRNIDFKTLCLKKSYISRDLNRIGVPQKCIAEIEANTNYYYMTSSERFKLRREIATHLSSNKLHVVTFCTRDLYTFLDIKKEYPEMIITHLILHDQDNLYVCQSIWDKFVSRYFNKQIYSRKKHIRFNSSIFNLLAKHGCIIPQCDLQVPLWKTGFGIDLEYSKVVPLPVCDFSEINPDFRDVNGKNIIWVGRIVDFKIPALCAMIKFVNRNKDYSLTIVGDGDRHSIDLYLEENLIDTNNISFVGQIDYSELSKIIQRHDIGYAMGTSIVEIAKFGIPVIMALAAPKKVLFKNEICGGVYSNVSKGNVGESLYCGQLEEDQPLIETAISQIEANYRKASEDCFKCVKSMFDSVINMEKYIDIIMSSKNFGVEDIEIPHATNIRRFFYLKHEGLL